MKTFVKILGQTGNLETEAKTLYYYSLPKKKKGITLKQDIIYQKSSNRLGKFIDRSSRPASCPTKGMP